MTHTPGFASKKILLRLLLEAKIPDAEEIVEKIPDADVQQIVHCSECEFCHTVANDTDTQTMPDLLECRKKDTYVTAYHSCEDGRLKPSDEYGTILPISRVVSEAKRLGWLVTNMDEITGHHSNIRRFICQKSFIDDDMPTLLVKHDDTISAEYGYGEILKADSGIELAQGIIAKANQFDRRQWAQYQSWLAKAGNIHYTYDTLLNRAHVIHCNLEQLSTTMHGLLRRYGYV